MFVPPLEGPRSRRAALQLKLLFAELKRRIWIRDQRARQWVYKTTGMKCSGTAFKDFDHRLEVYRGGQSREGDLFLARRSHHQSRYLGTYVAH